MLAQRLGPIPAVTLIGSLGPMVVHFTCHGAATYWLYSEAFDQDPPLDFFSTDMFIQCSNMMTKLAKFGRVLDPPIVGSINPAPGTVLIFVDGTGVAGHTCIINQNRKIAGYNQTGWFNPDTGLSHQYSVHNKRSIKWRSRTATLKVELSQNRPGNLIAVDEQAAINFFRHNYVQHHY